MKQVFLKWSGRLDGMSLRERAMVFAASAALIAFAVYSLLLSPLFQRQSELQGQIAKSQNLIKGIDDEISKKIDGFVVDPDIATRARLAGLKTEIGTLSDSLRAMQNGLVAPERMTPLLEKILRSNGRLKLVGMRTLPVLPMNEGSYAVAPPLNAAPAAGQAAAPAASAAPAPQPINLLFRHGVQLTVRGNYLDMVSYMSALEGMPTQLFWGQAALVVEDYPNAQLTLTLYTLSLDKKWMKL
jgi:MSHA biogenesis protein MshJ